MAKNLLHYTVDRKMFTGGILFIKLQGTTSCFLVLKLIMWEIIKTLELTRDEKFKLKSDNCSQDHMIEYIKTFFKGK